MKTAYEILAVAAGADDVAIKQAYLQQVKATPPDRDQEQFQSIHNAYQAIKDAKARLNYELFTVPVADFDQLLELALAATPSQPITPAQFQSLLQVCIDETTLQQVMAQS